MILKASQRGGAKQLALHLLRAEENEHVHVHEMRGFVSADLVGAFKEMQAVSKGTKCKQPLFSVSLNPPERENVSLEVFEQTIARIEEKIGLVGQPRALVVHEKEGRRHMHGIWGRIDTDTMKAINLPHFKLKLRDLSREIYLEHDWKMPRGLMNSAERDPRNFTLEQWQQSKRAGWNARDLKETLQDCYATSDSKASFEQALRTRGLMLAKGDRRSHVAITENGEVISIARYVNRKTKEVRAKLGDAETLPSIDEAKVQFAKDMTPAIRRLLNEARENKGRDLEPLDRRRHIMMAEQRNERTRLDAAQKRRWEEETRVRSQRVHQGLKGLWQMLTGERDRIHKESMAAAHAALQRDRSQRQSLVDAQLKDRQALQAEIQAVRERHADKLRKLREDMTRYLAVSRNQAGLKNAFQLAEEQRTKSALQRQPEADFSKRLSETRSGPSKQAGRAEPEREI